MLQEMAMFWLFWISNLINRCLKIGFSRDQGSLLGGIDVSAESLCELYMSYAVG